jgi:hypothetical protein
MFAANDWKTFQSCSIYINDLAEATKFKTILFADDTNLILSGKNLKELAARANNELESVRQYMAANKLSLNVKKTVFMVFNPVKKGEKRTEEDLQIVIGQQKLEEVCLFVCLFIRGPQGPRG